MNGFRILPLLRDTIKALHAGKPLKFGRRLPLLCDGNGHAMQGYMNLLQKLYLPALLVLTVLPRPSQALELVIGEERVKPGIVFVFEGAVKDHVLPTSLHLAEDQTHVHIEARVNWGEKGIPEGAPAGGFVPYLRITATVTNQNTGLSTFIDLLPHINLIDNFHYARNLSLPGAVDDLYTVKFTVVMPHQHDLALHRDWLKAHGRRLAKNQVFEYQNVDFAAIAGASRGGWIE